jgi:CspA family cold shock protein
MAVTGKVKFCDDAQGFGFIQRDDGGPDIFVHVRSLQRSGLETLSEGARVSFELQPDRRGRRDQAANVVVVS